MSSSTFSTNRVMHFQSGPHADKPLPEPLAPRSRPISLKSGAKSQSFDRQSGIRPEIVARARALAADPHYPPLAIIRHIAQGILVSADITSHDS